MSRGSTLEVPTFTSFFVVPEENYGDRFTSLYDTKKIVLDVFRPAQCALKVNKIAYAPNKGIRIEANKPDLAKLKSCLELANARLKVMENIKVNPRIIKFSQGDNEGEWREYERTVSAWNALQNDIK